MGGGRHLGEAGRRGRVLHCTCLPSPPFLLPVSIPEYLSLSQSLSYKLPYTSYENWYIMERERRRGWRGREGWGCLPPIPLPCLPPCLLPAFCDVYHACHAVPACLPCLYTTLINLPCHFLPVYLLPAILPPYM